MVIPLRASPCHLLMQRDQELKLKEYLSSIDTNERLKLYKRASFIRKNNRKPTNEEPNSKCRTQSLDDIVLKLIESEETPSSPTGPIVNGVVSWIGPKTCRVTVHADQIDYVVPTSSQVAIGDLVELSLERSKHEIHSICPRRTTLSRPDVGNKYKERVIAANVDVVVVVVSVVAPPLHPRIIVRYMIAIMKGGAKMVLAVNKCDLLNDSNRSEELGKLEPYRKLMTIVECSTVDGTGTETLRQLISGQVCAFVGHSGVGKSSLANQLAPDLNLETGRVSDGYGRGTHTTTSSTLYRLSDGTQVIDTPGIRSFGLWDISKNELSLYFPEFDEFQSRCKFRNCTHTHEPSCAVKHAVNIGQLSAHRYDAYVRILTFE